MATKARRITIEVGGEDAGAAKALKGAGKDADKLGQKLKAAGGDAKIGMGDVGDATDKLGTKFKQIDQDAKKGFSGIGDEADKLGSKLKAAGSEAGGKLKSGFESGVSGLGGAVESAGSTAADAISGGFDVSTITDSMTGVLQSVGGRIGPAAAGVGLVVGGAIATGIVNGMEVEATTDRLEAQLGDHQYADEAGEVAGRLYVDAFGDSVADTAGAVRMVIQRDLLPPDATEAQIEGLTGQFLTFTDVMEQDMDMATQAVSRMIQNGIAEDGTEALDILTRGVQTGADRAGDLLETFQEYSPAFSALGLSAEDATGLMAQGLNAGARDADKVADALKEIQIRAQDGSDASREAFEAIGLDADEMTAAFAAGGAEARGGLDQVLDGLRGIEDPAERNAAAVGLFGTQAEDLAGSLFALDLDTAASDMGEVAGSTDKLGSAYDNASTNIESFKRDALQSLTQFVGTSVLPKLEALKSWATDNPGAFQLIAGVIGGVLVLAFTAWAISAGMAAIATLAATWPILLIGALIVGLAILVAIHFETIKGWFETVFNWVSENWPLLLAILTGPIGAAVWIISSHWDTIKGAGKAVWDWISDNWPKLLAIVTGPFGAAAWIISSHWQTIKDGASGAKNWVVGRFNDLVGFVTGMPGRISSAASGMFDGITNAFRSAINAIIRGWNSLSFTLPSMTVPDIPGMPGRGSTVGGQTFSTPNIPTLDTGGIVPGMLGSPQLVLAHGGETYVPTHNPAAMRRFTSSAGAATIAAATGGDGGGGGDTYNFDLSGAVIASDVQLERTVVRAVNKAQGKGTTVKRRRSR